jgi:glycosyltransferase involved in cell wall biosynthesis
MKILYFIDSHPENGGAPISVCSIATRFSKIYSDTSIVLPSQDKEYVLDSSVENIEIEEFKNRFPPLIFNPIKGIKLAVKIRNIIINKKPDIVHACMPRAAWAIGLLKLFRLIPKGINLIYTDHDHLESYRWPVRLVCLLLINFQYNTVISLTEKSASFWKKQIGSVNINIIPNSAGKVYEDYDVEMHNRMREKYHIDKSAFTVMFSGRMSAVKNWGLAQEITLSLKNDVFFIFAILTMNKSQEEDLEKFKKMLNSSGIKYVLFHNANQDEMANYYYLADVFVLTSNKESFGRTAIEAMSRKCVVIGREVGGLPEVINKDENILELDVVAFHNRICEYKINSQILKKDKEWFYNRFVKHYTIANETQKHKDIYENIIAPK